MSLDFLSRMIGMVVFAVLGARLGADLGEAISLQQPVGGVLFGLVGTLFGIIDRKSVV